MAGAAQASLNRGRTDGFALPAPVLLLRYLTCEADGDHLRQLPGLYHRDEALAQAWQAPPAVVGLPLTMRGQP